MVVLRSPMRISLSCTITGMVIVTQLMLSGPLVLRRTRHDMRLMGSRTPGARTVLLSLVSVLVTQSLTSATTRVASMPALGHFRVIRTQRMRIRTCSAMTMIQSATKDWLLTSGQQEVVRWVAVGLMVVDHGAALLLEPAAAWPLRVLGRLAWPLFAFLLAYNVGRRGVDPARYLRPLLVWGLVSQPVWWLAFDRAGVNILGTLLLGVLVLFAFDRGHGWWPWLAAVALGLVGELVGVEYGAAGVLLPLMLVAALRQSTPLSWGQAVVMVLLQNWGWPGGWVAVLSGLVVWGLSRLELEQLRRWPRWLAWGFYPAHLVVLAGIRAVLG